MQQVLKAIWNRFSTTSTGAHTLAYQRSGGKMYFSEAREGTVMPYMTYHMISDSHDWQFMTDYEDITVQFSLYSETDLPTEIMNLVDGVKATFDDKVLDSSGYAHTYMIRGMSQLMKFADVLPGKSIWQATVDYDIRVRKT